MKAKSVKPGICQMAVALLLICFTAGTQAAAADLNLFAAPGSHFVPSGESMRKIGRDLAVLHQEYEDYLNNINVLADLNFKPNNRALGIAQGYVAVEAIAANDPEALRMDLQGLAMQNVAAFGALISGRLPITALNRLDQLKTLKFARPAYFVTNAGLVTSQGDKAMRSDVVRDELGIDGAGITIGTLSDSFNCLGGAAGNTASGDLPSNINVLDDSFCNSATDEGRAMMQLIADVAPGADQAFHTANGGQAVFAQGILDLADAGCDVIVDDIIYLAEPMFQDGIIAQAVNSVVEAGVAYFSSASNSGRNTYESSFVPGGTQVNIDGTPMGLAHDFDPGPGVDIYQSITIPGQARILLSLQWDSPHFSVSGSPGSPNDLNIFLIDVAGQTALAGSTVPNIGGDPVEVLVYTNTTSLPMNLDLLITKPGGPDPALMKYVIFSTAIAINEYGTPVSTAFGHSNAAGAASVAAALYARTPQFGFDPALVEAFSSVGGVPILFDTAGNKLSEPDIRSKPNMTAPDGTNTTFFGSFDYEGDGFPNFFGTSAAVAHAAAAAALVLASDPTMLPDEVYTVLETTALDMDNPYSSGFDADFDFATGWGFIQADLAVNEALAQPPAKPVNSNPADNAKDIPIDATLSWTDGGGGVSYDVYFGTDSTPDDGEFIGSQTSKIYKPANLQRSTTYYWRIDSKNANGTSTGDVWQFTTRAPPPLVTVTAEDDQASEKDSDPGLFRVRRTGETNAELTVNFWMSGTADNGKDYTLIQSPQIIPAGASYLDIQLSPTSDTQDEKPEKATLILQADANYTLGSTYIATITIEGYSQSTALIIDFVTRFYRYCLDRSPDPFGLNGWVSTLKSRGQTGGDLAHGFLSSPEFIGKDTTAVEYLAILYRTFFDREPDPAGLQGWLDALNDGADRNDVLDGFIHAGEFEALCDEYGIKASAGHITKSQKEAVAAFVTRFYQEVLERDPDPRGLANWVGNLLEHIQTGVDVAYGFIFSPEFIARNTTHEEYLTILYSAFFDRDPDPVGWDFWLAKLNSGRNRSDVLDGFLYSHEFAELSQGFGISPY